VRVLLVSDWAAQPGGIETTLTLVAGALRARGDEVALLTAGEDGTPLPDGYEARIAARTVTKAFRQIANADAVRAVRRAVEEFRPDVAYAHAFEHALSPAAIRALAPVPVVLSIANYKPVCPIALRLRPDDSVCDSRAGLVCRTGGCLGTPHWLRDQLRYRRIAAAVQQARIRVTCSDFMVRSLAADGVVARHLPLPVMGRGDAFARTPAAEPLFVYVGRLAREKGLAVLLQAFAAAHAARPAARLRLVGDGPERGRVEALASELGVASVVELRGWRDPVTIEEELRDAWALVAPSVWAEPLGLVAIEALVRGVPVIATGSGGFVETVGSVTPERLVPAGDPDALAAQLLTVAGAEPPAVDAQACAALARRHELGAHVDALRELFAEAAA
jgi:glycosyltransferase involved in cell wall biosynthesis